MRYLYLLQQAIIWIITIYWLYQMVVSFCSLIKLKDKPLKINKEHKFMAIIPAHNEEAVVGNLVESLQAQNYPRDKYDIYVIADNCTDDTAKVAKEAGAIVLKRFDDAHRTKGFALNWFLKQKIEEDADYDAFCVFDADNIVDPNFLKNMNKKLCQGEEIVQGYRDIKNPNDSWVSAGYAIFYWMMHRFYHLARYNLGLSALLNGTGFMVKFDLVKPNGWQTITLTEDIEFSLMNIIENRKVGWSTDAIVYDEQPITFMQSWSQRSRWSVGHLQCMKHYTKDLAKGVVEHKTLMNFDGLLYMFGMPIMVLTLLLLVINTLLFVGNEMTTVDLVGNFVRYLASTFIMPIIIAVVILKLDKRDIKPMWFGLLCYPLFMGSWILINIKCLINPNTKWEKINHVRDIKIREVA
ncbi:MAG: glycosyltransferase family 2 protein [Clostridia bacterium]|nr:glycosyltransferase family 2 protein [Clostridia bacterium]